MSPVITSRRLICRSSTEVSGQSTCKEQFENFSRRRRRFSDETTTNNLIISARLTPDERKFHHVTPLLVNLHWLCVPERIQYELCVLVHRCLNGAAPQYLSELIQPLSDADSRRRLRSVSTAQVLVPAIWGAQPLATVLLPSLVHVLGTVFQ